MSNTVVNTNVLALNSHRSLRAVGTTQSKASARLSSGLKINSGADDAAGLAISEKMRSQIRGLDMATKNSQDALSLVQVADGGLAKIDDMLQKVRDLAVQAANKTNQVADDVADVDNAGELTGTASDVVEATGPDAAADAKTYNYDTDKLATEADHLIKEMTAMSKRTEFNKINLLATGSTRTMQVGANANQTMDIEIGSVKDITDKLGEWATDAEGGNVVLEDGQNNEVEPDGTVEAIRYGGKFASAQLSVIDEAIEMVAKHRANLGAYSNRLEYIVEASEIASENTSAAESRIRDADMAKEMMNVSKANVLQQAATSMLSQANQAPQNILQLLR